MSSIGGEIPTNQYFEDIDLPILSDGTSKVEGYDRFHNLEIDLPDEYRYQLDLTKALDISELSELGAFAWLECAWAAHKLKEDNALETIVFSVGDGFLIQTAKFYAFRKLVASILNRKIRIGTRSAIYNKSKPSTESNLIKASAEYTAAVLGGADTLTPSGVLLDDESESIRLSNNMFGLLKHESGFDKPRVYSQGSYTIDQIAFSIYTKAKAHLKKMDPKTEDENWSEIVTLALSHSQERSKYITENISRV
ncbi:MAG: hypothetical protein Kapaf2KO_21480 [Candidatus Kapaibacteriales bacterium]